MNYYFLSSHGSLASGMKSSVDILCGSSENLTVFDAYLDERSVYSVLDKYFNQIPENASVYLLSDLYGGSVNQAMATFLERPNTHLISGVNLALVLELVNTNIELTEENGNCNTIFYTGLSDNKQCCSYCFGVMLNFV